MSSPERPQDGAAIRQIRKDLGLSEGELAHLAGLEHAASLRNIENGRRAPSLATLTKIADALDVRLIRIVRSGTTLHAALTNGGDDGQAA